MKINFTSKTIEVTKTFANKASRFGSEEYTMLRAATHDLPEFEVVIKAAPVRRRTYMCVPCFAGEAWHQSMNTQVFTVSNWMTRLFT